MKKYFSIFLLFTFYFLLSTTPQAIILSSEKGVGIFAGVEENRVTIFGFTSPDSRVELSNTIVFDVTYSKDNGYFEFNRIILPKNPGELCLTAIDNDSRHSNPTCIPAPPPTNYHTDIGPIVLPPTITIDSDSISANSTAAASGQSIPNSTINIFIYQVDPSAPTFPKPASAFGLPVFTTKSDVNGNYSLSLPTAVSSDFRLFSTVLFSSSPSPKSNTISFQLPTFQNNFLFVPLFLFSIIMFGYLLYLYFQKPPARYLPAIYYYPLIKYSILNQRK